ncbi:MAG TPA: hypothetical protein PLI45_04585 [Candidatus Woesebacteria bacterium]|nr:hypothetical protein [Candidatus Woesebacteria bacterium]
MKNVLKAFLVTVFLFMLFAPNPVSADDYVGNALEALQNGNVYVDPELIGTLSVDNDTASKLQSKLFEGDNLVLVMLPAEAETGTDIYAIAQRLSEGLGDQKIIGLAVGNKVIGYGPTLPSGVAADMMRRADNVSNNSLTALVTFSQNIHAWQEVHPQPTPTPTPIPTPVPQPTSAEDGQKSWVIGGISMFVVVIIAIVVLIKARPVMTKISRVQSFAPLKKLIENIQENANEIRDTQVRIELNEACLVADGVVENLQNASKPQGYIEEKFPELLKNMDEQTMALLGHESRKHPLNQEILGKLKQVLLGYDDIFLKFQEGDEDAARLLATIIDSQQTAISTLGYLPEDHKNN